jgi:hypothetical protein
MYIASKSTKHAKAVLTATVINKVMDLTLIKSVFLLRCKTVLKKSILIKKLIKVNKNKMRVLSMMRYANRTGRSNVSGYEIGDEFIRVKFNRAARIYTYSHRKAGKHRVDKLKILAQVGHGLNSYINISVKKLYD